MASDMEVHMKQRRVIEFLHEEKKRCLLTFIDACSMFTGTKYSEVVGAFQAVVTVT